MPVHIQYYRAHFFHKGYQQLQQLSLSLSTILFSR